MLSKLSASSVQTFFYQRLFCTCFYFSLHNKVQDFFLYCKLKTICSSDGGHLTSTEDLHKNVIKRGVCYPSLLINTLQINHFQGRRKGRRGPPRKSMAAWEQSLSVRSVQTGRVGSLQPPQEMNGSVREQGRDGLDHHVDRQINMRSGCVCVWWCLCACVYLSLLSQNFWYKHLLQQKAQVFGMVSGLLFEVTGHFQVTLCVCVCFGKKSKNRRGGETIQTAFYWQESGVHTEVACWDGWDANSRNLQWFDSHHVWWILSPLTRRACRHRWRTTVEVNDC